MTEHNPNLTAETSSRPDPLLRPDTSAQAAPVSARARVTPAQLAQLERQGCTADDWNRVSVAADADLSLVRDVDFEGSVSIGRLDRSLRRDAGLRRALLRNVTLGDDVAVRNVPGGVANCTVGDRATIDNVARIDFETESPCGVGTQVSVLDETGSRPVTIYPGLSAQLATLCARSPRWAEKSLNLCLPDWLENRTPTHSIGDDATVRDSGPLLNVHVGREATVEGARRLTNGSVINNAAPGRPLAYVGHGVDAEDFVFEDARVEAGAIIRRSYVGQGAVVEKGFTSHDSLFFANCSLENGEACALFAGPYTVSMHKGTLLIGAQTTFMNAGSATNQSNHMYKLGPVHWGVLERGVKTSSNSYLMLGARIGAFSLLMGSHKTHPDSTQFPFSYLFGDERGATVVVPAQMLRSCGLLRDEKKWPTRDRRLKRRLPLNDRINFEVLSPYTVDSMIEALDIIEELLKLEADDDRVVRYRGMKFARAALERARHLYTLAIFKYLHERLGSDLQWPEHDGSQPKKWLDLAGQIITRDTLDHLLTLSHPDEIERALDAAHAAYPDDERRWIGARFGQWWRDRTALIAEYAAEFDRQVEQDRTDYLSDLQAQHTMLAL